ncbi:PepSY-associated TM helix domain-containing protein [Phenylobacterium sp.]|uniref:PepSY-associated TM helix domain-containing protein n=1 Tax=Phenylobacterium sp. TaxID=1871053 RepID=UPI002FCB1C16
MGARFTARLRRLWLNVHLWLGVGLLAAFLPLAASGAALVWRDELERALEPQRYSVSDSAASRPPSTYLKAATDAFKGRAEPVQVRFPERPGNPVLVVGRTSGGLLAAWLDPATGAVREVGDPRASLLGFLHNLHGSLMIPEIGRKIVGWLGWAMFVSCATGLWLWWPRNGAVLKALRWRRGPSTLFNLHHMVGFWICLPLAVLSITGVCVAFPQASRGLFGVVDEEPAVSAGRNPPGSIDDAVAVARTVEASAPLLAVILPDGGEADAWSVRFGGEQPKRIDVLLRTGEVRVSPAGDPLSRGLRQVHDGAQAWPLWRVVIFLGGLAPVVLVLSGVTIWLRRQLRKRRRVTAADTGRSA